MKSGLIRTTSPSVTAGQRHGLSWRAERRDSRRKLAHFRIIELGSRDDRLGKFKMDIPPQSLIMEALGNLLKYPFGNVPVLNILGSGSRFCDGISRRSLLKIGGLAMGGLSLPDLVRLEAATGRTSQKAVIMVFLTGGPPHQDMVDLKMDAPVEIRGEFRPIATNVPGIDVCELLPLLAQRMDRM